MTDPQSGAVLTQEQRWILERLIDGVSNEQAATVNYLLAAQDAQSRRIAELEQAQDSLKLSLGKSCLLIEALTKRAEATMEARYQRAKELNRVGMD